MSKETACSSESLLFFVFLFLNVRNEGPELCAKRLCNIESKKADRTTSKSAPLGISVSGTF